MLACLALISCGIPGSTVMWAETKQYSGDGVIHSCSNLFGGGFAIDFPTFDSSRPYAASYRLSHVPQTGRGSVIYLRFERSGLLPSAAQRKTKSATSTFRFTICDAKGSVLDSADFHVSNAILTQTGSIFGIYELGKSEFRFEYNNSYVLKVSYVPGSVPPPAKQLYFAIDNCAFY